MTAFPPGEWTAIAPTTDGFVSVREGAQDLLPVAILCHERYGLVKHTCDLAQRFAAAGYLAIAPNFYADYEGDIEAVHCGEEKVMVTDDSIRQRIDETITWATQHGGDPEKVAIIGICASGSYPILSNGVRPDIAANVIMYGGAVDSEWRQTDDEYRPIAYQELLAGITAPVLGVWGEADHVTSVPEVLHLRDELEKARKSYLFRIWRDMPHGWLNDTMPGRYRHREAEQAFLSILDWLDEVFAGGYPEDKVRWDLVSDIRPDYEPSLFTRLA